MGSVASKGQKAKKSVEGNSSWGIIQEKLFDSSSSISSDNQSVYFTRLYVMETDGSLTFSEIISMQRDVLLSVR